MIELIPYNTGKEYGVKSYDYHYKSAQRKFDEYISKELVSDIFIAIEAEEIRFNAAEYPPDHPLIYRDCLRTKNQDNKLKYEIQWYLFKLISENEQIKSIAKLDQLDFNRAKQIIYDCLMYVAETDY